MSDVVIWHNARCSKSRQTLALLEERGLSPKIVKYLEEPPTAAELERVLGLLDVAPRELMRKKEAAYGELGLGDEGKTRGELIAAMVENPTLIERPLVVVGDAAALGRPPENVLSILPG